MIARTKEAFAFTMGNLFKTGQCYMWTFTFREVMTDARVGNATRSFLHALKRLENYNIGGVRIYEVHPGGHGVHLHVVINRRIPAKQVWRIAKRNGLGWLSVKKCYGEASELARYLGKYLAKDGPKMDKGVRKWQSFGTVKRSRVRGIKIETSENDAVRATLAKIKREGRKPTYSDFKAAVGQAKVTGYS